MTSFRRNVPMNEDQIQVAKEKQAKQKALKEALDLQLKERAVTGTGVGAFKVVGSGGLSKGQQKLKELQLMRAEKQQGQPSASSQSSKNYETSCPRQLEDQTPYDPAPHPCHIVDAKVGHHQSLSIHHDSISNIEGVTGPSPFSSNQPYVVSRSNNVQDSGPISSPSNIPNSTNICNNIHTHSLPARKVYDLNDIMGIVSVVKDSTEIRDIQQKHLLPSSSQQQRDTPIPPPPSHVSKAPPQANCKDGRSSQPKKRGNHAQGHQQPIPPHTPLSRSTGETDISPLPASSAMIPVMQHVKDHIKQHANTPQMKGAYIRHGDNGSGIAPVANNRLHIQVDRMKKELESKDQFVAKILEKERNWEEQVISLKKQLKEQKKRQVAPMKKGGIRAETAPVNGELSPVTGSLAKGRKLDPIQRPINPKPGMGRKVYVEGNMQINENPPGILGLKAVARCCDFNSTKKFGSMGDIFRPITAPNTLDPLSNVARSGKDTLPPISDESLLRSTLSKPSNLMISRGNDGPLNADYDRESNIIASMRGDKTNGVRNSTHFTCYQKPPKFNLGGSDCDEDGYVIDDTNNDNNEDSVMISTVDSQASLMFHSYRNIQREKDVTSHKKGMHRNMGDTEMNVGERSDLSDYDTIGPNDTDSLPKDVPIFVTHRHLQWFAQIQVITWQQCDKLWSFLVDLEENRKGVKADATARIPSPPPMPLSIQPSSSNQGRNMDRMKIIADEVGSRKLGESTESQNSSLSHCHDIGVDLQNDEQEVWEYNELDEEMNDEECNNEEEDKGHSDADSEEMEHDTHSLGATLHQKALLNSSI